MSLKLFTDQRSVRIQPFVMRACLLFSCHPSMNRIATGSGQRHFSMSLDIDSDSDVESDDWTETDIAYDNSLKIWHIDFNVS